MGHSEASFYLLGELPQLKCVTGNAEAQSCPRCFIFALTRCAWLLSSPAARSGGCAREHGFGGDRARFAAREWGHPSPRVATLRSLGGSGIGRVCRDARLPNMLIDFTLTLDEISALLREATPLRIHLTEKDEDRRWVELESPTEVTLVPHVGLRAVSSGRIRYEVAGIKLPVSIRRIQILLEPEVVPPGAGHQRLDFKLRVEAADLELIPELGERVLINVVNEALAPARLGMSVPFARLLERRVSLPERFEPLEQLRLGAALGAVQVTELELRFQLQLALGFTRNKERPTDD